MKIYRNNLLFNLGTIPCSIAAKCWYHAEFEGAENMPKKGPALILPKHQNQMDIILEGVMLKYCAHRYGNWIMKEGLPKALYALGGFSVGRVKDIRMIKDREERKIAISHLKAENQKMKDYIDFLYSQDEIVVMHPEGERKPGEMGQIKTELIYFSKGCEQKNGIEIPAVPIGIEYIDSSYGKVYVRAGKPVSLQNPDIEKIIFNEIKTLSGL